MKKMTKFMAALAVTTMLAAPSSAETFKYAFQGDAQGLDPHGLNETFSLGFLGNVYEGLTKYDGDLQLQPALATSWETTSPTTWLVKLRQGVKFHNGNDFNADDVIFSWKRTQTEGSDQKARGGMITDIKKIDDHTIELITAVPQPVLMQELTFIYIMDKEWAEANDAVEAANVKDTTKTGYASNNSNGTGPFKIVERKAGVKSVFERFDGYWDKGIKTNVTRAEFTPVKEAATRVAALISKQLDLVFPVPVQDWQRLEDAEGVRPLAGPEARTIFLGMDQGRDELLHSSVKGKNPFKDIRVRQAFAHAINLDAIKKKIMRGASTPTGLMVAPQINGFNKDLNTPYAYDPKKSKALLAEAGYPDGFTVTMDCPNNRYVNDEKICQAVASMMARVGVKIDLLAQPKSKYFGKVLAQNGYDTSFYLLGWTPGSIDSHNVYQNLLSCQNKEKRLGAFNLGNYCNARVDEISSLMGSETDPVKRQALIDEGFKIVQDEVGYLPLHQQPLSWGASEKVDVVQRADNILDLRNVVVNK
ncbi:MAG: ABC transporter substrate-binding protein [Cohaesibacter sp.]|jgi:peptide/nickel transport system substrate-binding protein|nr:ABC transporter substrate-binding protein [Cohaesibacter sp.]